VASLGVITATFPLQRRITGPEVARNERWAPGERAGADRG